MMNDINVNDVNYEPYVEEDELENIEKSGSSSKGRSRAGSIIEQPASEKLPHSIGDISDQVPKRKRRLLKNKVRPYI